MSFFRLSIPQFLACENPKSVHFAKISFDRENVRAAALNSFGHNDKFYNRNIVFGAAEREMAEYGPEKFVLFRRKNVKMYV